MNRKRVIVLYCTVLILVNADTQNNFTRFNVPFSNQDYYDCTVIFKNRIAHFESMHFASEWIYPAKRGIFNHNSLKLDWMTPEDAKSYIPDKSYAKWFLHPHPNMENGIIMESFDPEWKNYYVFGNAARVVEEDGLIKYHAYAKYYSSIQDYLVLHLCLRFNCQLLQLFFYFASRVKHVRYFV